MGSYKNELDDNAQVSITAYRTLLILKSLIEKSLSIDELVGILKNDSVTSKSVSKDTARLTLNTLKAAGCIISRPSRKNGYRYELVYNPFWLSFTDEEMSILIRLRENLEDKVHWKDVITLNNLYSKIIGLTCNKEQIALINDTKCLGDVRPEIIEAFVNNNIICKKILVEYISPQYKEEELYVIPFKIIYENRRLYTLCYSLKYEGNCFLDMSRIKKIKTVNTQEKYTKANYYSVIYRLSGLSMHSYERTDYETILERTDSYIDIKANVTNEFVFMQRLILFGVDFKVLSPAMFKEKIINKIKSAQRNYEE